MRIVVNEDRRDSCAWMRRTGTAPAVDAAALAFDQFEDKPGPKNPGSIRFSRYYRDRLTCSFACLVDLRRLGFIRIGNGSTGWTKGRG